MKKLILMAFVMLYFPSHSASNINFKKFFFTKAPIGISYNLAKTAYQLGENVNFSGIFGHANDLSEFIAQKYIRTVTRITYMNLLYTDKPALIKTSQDALQKHAKNIFFSSYTTLLHGNKKALMRTSLRILFKLPIIVPFLRLFCKSTANSVALERSCKKIW